MASLLFMLVFLGLAIAYLVTLGNTLQAVRPENRSVEPSDVWLMLFPLYNYVWAFLLYKRIARSLTAEYRSRGMTDSADNTFIFGAIAAACMVTGTFLNLIDKINGTGDSLITSLISLVGLVFWITYWIMINGHKNRIKRLPKDEQDTLIFNR